MTKLKKYHLNIDSEVNEYNLRLISLNNIIFHKQIKRIIFTYQNGFRWIKSYLIFTVWEILGIKVIIYV